MTRTAIQQRQLEEEERHNKATEVAGVLGAAGSLIGGIGKAASGVAHFKGKGGRK